MTIHSNTKNTTHGQNDPPPKYYEWTECEVHAGPPVDHVYDVGTDEGQVPDISRKRKIAIYTRVRVAVKKQFFFIFQKLFTFEIVIRFSIFFYVS